MVEQISYAYSAAHVLMVYLNLFHRTHLPWGHFPTTSRVYWDGDKIKNGHEFGYHSTSSCFVWANRTIIAAVTNSVHLGSQTQAPNSIRSSTQWTHCNDTLQTIYTTTLGFESTHRNVYSHIIIHNTSCMQLAWCMHNHWKGVLYYSTS